MTKFKIIPIENLIETAYPVRKNFDGLETSVDLHGVLSPITVHAATKPGDYIIIDGMRRYKAAYANNYFELPCIIVNADSGDVSRIQFVLNPTLPLPDRRKLLLRLMATKPQHTITDFSDCVLGISVVEIAEILQLNKLDIGIMADIRSGKISLCNAYQLTKLVGKVPDMARWVSKAQWDDALTFTVNVKARLKGL